MLGLSENKIGDEGVQYIANALARNTVQQSCFLELHIHYCHSI